MTRIPTLLSMCAVLVLAASGVAGALDWSGDIRGIDYHSGKVYSINSTTGVCTYDFNSGVTNIYGASTWDVTHAGHILATDVGSLYDIDTIAGSATSIGSYSGAVSSIYEMGFDVTNGVLYGTDYTALYTINPSTLVTTNIGNLSASNLWAMTYIDGVGLYGVASATDKLYKINTGNASLTTIGATGVDRIIDIEYDYNAGKLIGSTNGPAGIYELSLTNGSATFLNGTGVPNMLGLAMAAPTPELSSGALLLVGMLPIGVAWWRRRRS